MIFACFSLGSGSPAPRRPQNRTCRPGTETLQHSDYNITRQRQRDSHTYAWCSPGDKFWAHKRVPQDHTQVQVGHFSDATPLAALQQTAEENDPHRVMRGTKEALWRGQLRPGGPTKPSRRSLSSGCRFGLSPSRQSATQPGCSHQRPVLPLGVDKEEEGQKEREGERERERERKRKTILFAYALLFVAQPFKSASQVVSGGKVHTGETGECTVWRCPTQSASDACVWTAVDPPEGLCRTTA